MFCNITNQYKCFSGQCFKTYQKIIFKNTPLFIVLPHTFKKGQVKKKNKKKSLGAVQREKSLHYFTINKLIIIPNAIYKKLMNVNFKARCHSHIYAVVSG